jgi:hypothetical protein
MNEFLTKEEKEKIRARVEKSLVEIKQKYKNHTLANKNKTYEQRQRDLQEYTK